MTTKPLLFVVDDEPTALAAIERDLRRAYGTDFRIVCATSGSEALERCTKGLNCAKLSL